MGMRLCTRLFGQSMAHSMISYRRRMNQRMNTRLYKCDHNLLIPIHRKFNDDIFARFLVIMNNFVISFIKEYRGPTFRPPCDVIGDVIIMKNTFYGIIWDNLFISDVKLKLCLIFQNGRHYYFYFLLQIYLYRVNHSDRAVLPWCPVLKYIIYIKMHKTFQIYLK